MLSYIYETEGRAWMRLYTGDKMYDYYYNNSIVAKLFKTFLLLLFMVTWLLNSKVILGEHKIINKRWYPRYSKSAPDVDYWTTILQ